MMVALYECIRTILGSYTPKRIHDDSLTPSAVLIILFSKHDEPHILLTLRASSLAKHSGEISCPGGVRAIGDKTLLDTALRETHEELGIAREQLDILGVMDDYETITGYRITPYVAYLIDHVEYTVNREEVAEVIEVPYCVFSAPESDQYEVWEYAHAGTTRMVYFFQYDGYVVWGATAFMLHKLVTLVLGYDPVAETAIHRHLNTS